MNIVDLVLFQCRLQPAAAALCAPGADLGLMSYGRLERAIYNIGIQAKSLGLGRGNVVALFVQDQILHAALILGLCRLGIVTLSGRSAELPNEMKIDAVISDTSHPFKNTGRIIRADKSWIEGEGGPGAQPEGSRGEDLCRIILTSGTTGDPKAVAFSHDMVLARILRHNTVFGSGLPDCSRIFVDLGFATSLGYFFLIYTLARGGTLFFRGSDAAETMQAFGLYKVQAMVAAPAGLAEFLGYYEGASGFPPSFDVVVTGGSLLSGPLSERVRARLCANLISAYGSTEASVVAAAPAHAIAQVEGAVGYVTPGVSVEIVDQSENVLPAGNKGAVRIRSEFAADCYLGDPAESKKAFRDGWFYPGDIGSLTAGRLLVISSREKLVLNVGGDKVNPERIEQVLAAFPGIVRAGAFTVLDVRGIEELCAAVVSPSPIDEQALRAHCERSLPPEFVPRRFLPVREIPLNDMGKIDRWRLAGLLKAD